MEPVEGRGQDLLGRRIRQQIAGHLPERELIPGQVVVEGLDHPVAPGPHRGSRPIDLEAVAVGVAGEIHPVGGHPLAVPRAGEEPVEEFVVGIGRCVGEERLNLGRRGGQSGDVEARAADERDAIGLGLEGEATGGELFSDNRVDAGRGLGRLGLHGRHERPVRLVGRPFGDPAFERGHLLGRESADLGLGGRHHDVWIIGDDAGKQLAGRRVLRHDRPQSALELLGRLLEGVEPQARLPVAAVGAVAGEAVVREDRPDVLIEGKPCGRLGRRGVCQHGCRRDAGQGNQEESERQPGPGRATHVTHDPVRGSPASPIQAAWPDRGPARLVDRRDGGPRAASEQSPLSIATPARGVSRPVGSQSPPASTMILASGSRSLRPAAPAASTAVRVR